MLEKFGRDCRLRARREFTAVQDNGWRVSARFLTLLAQSNTLGRDRLGVIASKRIGGAVSRNRAKRRIREMFRREVGEMSTSRGPSLDVVAIARRDLVDAPFAVLRADFDSAMRKLRQRTR